MTPGPEPASVEKSPESRDQHGGATQAALAPDGAMLDPFVEGLFGGAPAGPPDSAAGSLSVQRLKAPVLQRAQRLYGNRASQQIVNRARTLQRQCACSGTCPKCHEEEEQRALQRSSRSPAPAEFDGIPATPGEPLDPATRQPLEAHFGADLDGVRVHTGAEVADSADRLDALAYTSGRDIYFAAGMYAPASSSGRRLLAHEVAHVVQQSSGKEPGVATKSASVKIGAPDDSLETEAEQEADEFMSGAQPALTEEEQRKRRESSGSLQRSSVIQRKRADQPESGAIAIGSLVARDCPSLLAVLTPEEMGRWQGILNVYAHNAKLSAREAEVAGQYQKLTPGSQSYQYYSDYRDAISRIESRMQGWSERDQWVQVESSTILSSDIISGKPAWNIAAEAEFRNWLSQQFTSRKVSAKLELSAPRPRIVVWWDQYTLELTHGYVTFAQLIEFQQFKKEYEDRVVDGPLVQEIRQGIVSLRVFIDQWKEIHRDRSEANYPEGDSYWDSVRRVKAKWFRRTAELVGKGSAPYPLLEIWDRPNYLYLAANQQFNQGHYEVAMALLQEAASKAGEAANAVAGYENRIVSGVSRIVTGLEVLKFGGKVAATFLPGGILARGAYAATYSVAQQSAERGTQLWLGQVETFGAGDILKEGALEGALSVFSDITVGRFTKALDLRFGDRLAMQFGRPISDFIIKTGAVATAAPYNAAAREVMNRVIRGQASVNSLDDLSNLIVDQVLQDSAMHALLSPFAGLLHGEEGAPHLGEHEALAKTPEPGKKPELPETERPREPGESKSAPDPSEPVLPAAPSAIPGHDIKITPDGKLVRCSNQCQFLLAKYETILDRAPGLKEAMLTLQDNAKKLGFRETGRRAALLEEQILDFAVERVLGVASVPESEMPALRQFLSDHPEQLERLDVLLEARELEPAEKIDVPTQVGGIDPQTRKTVRQGATTQALRDWVNQVGGYVRGMGDPALPGRTILSRLQPDHIYALRRVVQELHVTDLSDEELLSIARWRGNLAGISAAANYSKGAKSYFEWREHKVSGTKVDPDFRVKMYLRELDAEDDLRILVDWVRANGPLPANMKPREMLAVGVTDPNTGEIKEPSPNPLKGRGSLGQKWNERKR
jgi:hypothetical protein